MKNKNIIAAILLLATLALLAIPVFAEENTLIQAKNEYTNDIDVIPDFTSDYIEGRGEIIDSISSDSTFWSVSSSSMKLKGITSMQTYPYRCFDEDGCLRVACDDASSNSWYYITHSFGGKGLDLSSFGSIVFALCCDYIDRSSELSVIVKVYSRGILAKSCSYSGVKSETWNGVICNISDIADRDRVTSIKIGIRRSSPTGESFSLRYHIDQLFACTTNALPRVISFSSEAYSINGTYNTIDFSPDNSAILISGAEEDISEELSISSGKIPSAVFDDADAVKVRFRICEGASLNTLQLEYTTLTNQSFKKNAPIIQSVEQTNDTQVCYFPLRENGITQLKLTMNVEAHGNFEIYSITPASFYSPLSKSSSGNSSSSLGGITSCRISSDANRKIVIKCSFSRDELSAYRGMSVALYELQPFMSNDILFDNDLKYIKKTTVNENFSFEIPLYEGSRSRITSRFAIILDDSVNARGVLLGSPAYITNTDIIADSNVRRNTSLTKKGCICSSSAAYDSTTSHTIVNLDLNRLFSDSIGYTEYEYSGKVYKLDSDYISELDSEINDLLLAGCSVNIRFILSRSLTAANDSPLVDVISDTKIAYRLGFNVRNEESVRILEAASKFIAEHFFVSHDGKYTASGIIVGSDLDYAFRYYNLGLITLKSYTDSYLRAFRVIFNTVRSVCSDVRVYIPLGNEWDTVCWDNPALKFSSRDLLDSISAQLRAEGQIPCSLTFDPYTEREPLITEINTTDGTVSAYPLTGGYITLPGIPELCRYLKQSRLLCDGSSRSFMLVHDTEPIYALTESVDVSSAAYEYTLAYEIICSDACSAVECFIIDDSFISKGDKRSLYSLLSGIDTPSSDSLTSSALEHFGIDSWTSLSDSISSINTAGRYFEQRGISSSISGDIAGSCLLWDFGGHDVSIPICLVSSNGNTQQDSPGVFVFNFSAEDMNSVLYVFPYARDLSPAPLVSFPITCSESCSVTVEFRSSSGRARYIGECSANTEHQLVCNLSDFPGIGNIDSMLVSFGPSEKTTVSPTSSVKVNVGDVTVSSHEFSDDRIAELFRQENEKLINSDNTEITGMIIKIAAAVIVMSVILEIIYIAARIKRNAVLEEQLENEKRERFRQRFGE